MRFFAVRCLAISILCVIVDKQFCTSSPVPQNPAETFAGAETSTAEAEAGQKIFEIEENIHHSEEAKSQVDTYPEDGDAEEEALESIQGKPQDQKSDQFSSAPNADYQSQKSSGKGMSLFNDPWGYTSVGYPLIHVGDKEYEVRPYPPYWFPAGMRDNSVPISEVMEDEAPLFDKSLGDSTEKDMQVTGDQEEHNKDGSEDSLLLNDDPGQYSSVGTPVYSYESVGYPLIHVGDKEYEVRPYPPYWFSTRMGDDVESHSKELGQENIALLDNEEQQRSQDDAELKKPEDGKQIIVEDLLLLDEPESYGSWGTISYGYESVGYPLIQVGDKEYEIRPYPPYRFPMGDDVGSSSEEIGQQDETASMSGAEFLNTEVSEEQKLHYSEETSLEHDSQGEKTHGSETNQGAAQVFDGDFLHGGENTFYDVVLVPILPEKPGAIELQQVQHEPAFSTEYPKQGSMNEGETSGGENADYKRFRMADSSGKEAEKEANQPSGHVFEKTALLGEQFNFEANDGTYLSSEVPPPPTYPDDMEEDVEDNMAISQEVYAEASEESYKAELEISELEISDEASFESIEESSEEQDDMEMLEIIETTIPAPSLGSPESFPLSQESFEDNQQSREQGRKARNAEPAQDDEYYNGLLMDQASDEKHGQQTEQKSFNDILKTPGEVYAIDAYTYPDESHFSGGLTVVAAGVLPPEKEMHIQKGSSSGEADSSEELSEHEDTPDDSFYEMPSSEIEADSADSSDEYYYESSEEESYHALVIWLAGDSDEQE